MNDTHLKARPTTYRGIHMRSRLEARVAAVLDVAGHPWVYEPNAFASPAGQYLPDFRVDKDLYIEVKPHLPVSQILPWQKRMEIIWESQPDASLMLLLVDSDEAWCAYGPYRDEGWYHRSPSGWF